MESYSFIGFFLLLLGLSFLCPAIWMLFKLVKAMGYISSTATISSYKKIVRTNGGSAHPVYKYNAEYYIGDKKYSVLSTYSSTTTSILPSIGTQINIKFNPNNPNEVIVTPSLQLFQVIFAGSLGGILFYIGYTLITNQIPKFLMQIVESL